MQSMQIPQIAPEADKKVLETGPRVALLTSYNGGNLGDAAIQDAMISNLRLRIPRVQFFGITLNCDNFVKQHGAGAFPLLSAMLPPSYGSRGSFDPLSHTPEVHRPQPAVWKSSIRNALRRIPGLLPLVKKARARVATVRREILHSLQGYRVLRQQDLLLISGGGQLDDEYGGPWRLPFALCKWAVLARLARVPCAMASVGASKMSSPTSRRFVSLALRLCCYRSFREKNSRAIVASILSRAADDSVVPDLAFSLPESELSEPAGNIRKMARGRPIIAVSPIAYAKPGSWPTPNLALHDRYVQQLAEALSHLLRRGYFLVLACSSLGDDESVIPDLLGRLDDKMKCSLDGQIHLPTVKTWREFVAVLRDADYLIASRLHGTILGFLAQTPAVAISFDPKVDWIMELLHQTDYLMNIRDFAAEDVINAVDRIHLRRDEAVEQIVSYRHKILAPSAVSARQYDVLAEFVQKHWQSHS